MLCNDKKIIGVAGLVLALALSLPQIVQGAKGDGGPDRAMQDFVSAVKTKNTNRVLAAFSQTKSWELVEYDIQDARRIIRRTAVTYTQMEQDFRNRKGWYVDLILSVREVKDPSGDTFWDTITGMPRWFKEGTAYSNGSKKIRFYISAVRLTD